MLSLNAVQAQPQWVWYTDGYQWYLSVYYPVVPIAPAYPIAPSYQVPIAPAYPDAPNNQPKTPVFVPLPKKEEKTMPSLKLNNRLY
jgi:hypothetical protein